MDFDSDFALRDREFMRRALQLATFGYGFTYTNPMVGAVIATPSGRIIGEGWHRRFGAPHAEVNAVRSVSEADRKLLAESTIYVTLEPCSHYGKTPPCAGMIVDERIPRVVIGAIDPFPAVAGRGIDMLRKAGCEVLSGVLEDECEALNLTFMTAHRLRRPFVMLKWAQSANGYIAAQQPTDYRGRTIISTPLSSVAMHRLRASFQAIMVGVNTVIADNPRLDCRLWPAAHRPHPVSRESSRLPDDSHFMQREHILRGAGEHLEDFLNRLYTDNKITALLVEGGRETLQELLDLGLFDMLRVETSPALPDGGVKAPSFDPSQLVSLAPAADYPAPQSQLLSSSRFGANTVALYAAPHIPAPYIRAFFDHCG